MFQQQRKSNTWTLKTCEYQECTCWHKAYDQKISWISDQKITRPPILTPDIMQAIVYHSDICIWRVKAGFESFKRASSLPSQFQKMTNSDSCQGVQSCALCLSLQEGTLGSNSRSLELQVHYPMWKDRSVKKNATNQMLSEIMKDK